MKKSISAVVCVVLATASAMAFVSGSVWAKAASESANEAADNAMYKEVSYANKSKPGPKLVVIPGEIKSANASFEQKVTANNIADYGELELGKAGFVILERTDLGPLLDELKNAVNLGDKNAMAKFKKGKLETTRWFVKFDILKAEPVAAAKKGFSGKAVGNLLGNIKGTGGAVASTTVGSVETTDAAGIWIVGMRYKILDAATSEQVGTGYFEGKMEIGAKGTSVLGISSSKESGVTLDTMAQRLVQMCVAEIDAKNK